MPLPKEAITLTTAQIGELNQKLADLRHDVNNSLALMTASVELMQRRPASAGTMLSTLIEQPRKISTFISQFSHEFETALHITRP